VDPRVLSPCWTAREIAAPISRTAIED